MKRLGRLWLPLFTLLLVAAGAAMPFAASYFQDAREGETEVRDFDSFSLTLRQETDLGRTLRLIAGSDYYIAENEWAEDARMTQAEVLAAAEELIKELTQFGLMEYPVSTLPTIYPQILCANDGSVSIPTWTLDWDRGEGEGTFYVWLDDASGKAFLISLSSMRYGKSSLSNAGSEHIYAYAENWRAFLEEYYGTEVHIGNEMRFDYTMRVALVFSLGTGEDAAEYQLDLYNYFLDGFTTLNPYVQENAITTDREQPPLPTDG